VTDEHTDTVAVVGVGALGSAIAGRIASAGLDLLVYDADAERAATVAEEIGATAALDLAALADASVVVLLLPDSSIVEKVVPGENGLLRLLRPGSLVLDMGSSDPRSTVRLAEAAAAEDVEYADAPVSGGVRRARAGDLTIMFGGSESQLERVRPLFDAVGSKVVPTGAVGSAHAMKALNNLLSAVGLAAALEVIEVGRRFGLEPHAMLDVLNGSSGQNNATSTKVAQYVLSETYDAGFGLRLMLKDVRTAISMARELDASTPLGDACLALWARAADELPPDADHTEIGSVLR
jgi:3-hydroxyisobutyrate dehydrogenase